MPSRVREAGVMPAKRTAWVSNAPALGEPGAFLSRAAANDDRITAVQDVSPRSTALASPDFGLRPHARPPAPGAAVPTLRASLALLAGNASGCLAQALTFTCSLDPVSLLPPEH